MQAIRFLRDEIEKQRRKSTADQGVIRKLDQIINEKTRAIDDSKRRHTSL